MRLAISIVLVAVPAAAEPLVPQPLAGPYADVTQVCAPCTTTARRQSPGQPIREVRVIFSGDPDVRPTPSNQLVHYLAIRTARGWFVQDLGFSGVICGGRSQSMVSLSPHDLVAHDVLGDGAPEVELDVDSGVMGSESQIDDRHHLICALDGHGTPRCADLFVARRAAHAADSWDYTLIVSRASVTLAHDTYGHADAPFTWTMP